MTIVSINETYGFTVSEREYSLHKYVTVDPTKAPTYKSKLGVSPPQPYEKWTPIGHYYPVTAAGIQAMLQYVAFRTAGDGFTDIGPYLAAIQAELSRLNALISSELIPAVPEVGA